MNCNKAYNSNKNGYGTTLSPDRGYTGHQTLCPYSSMQQEHMAHGTWHEYQYKNVNYNLEKKRVTFRWQYLGKIFTDFKKTHKVWMRKRIPYNLRLCATL